MCSFTCAADVTIHIKPPIALPHEAADFMQAQRPTRQAVAGDEFDFGMIGVDQSVLSDLKTQPSGLWIKLDAGGAVCGVPRIQQILFTLKHKSAVTRTHQALRVRGWHRVKVVDVPATALRIGQRALANEIATGTKRGRIRHDEAPKIEKGSTLIIEDSVSSRGGAAGDAIAEPDIAALTDGRPYAAEKIPLCARSNAHARGLCIDKCARCRGC